MPTVSERIAERFLEELSKSEDLTKEQIDDLRPFLAQGSKLKVQDIMTILTASPEDTAL